MSSSTILDEIIAAKRLEVAARRDEVSESALAAHAAEAPPARDFAAALGGDAVALIAEFKRRSPSAGRIRADLDPASVGRSYQKGGAAAISVLTDKPYFGGELADLRAVSDAVGIPVLRKDFIIDAYQVAEARVWGADAVLLIAAALPVQKLRELREEAERYGMAALVEAHDGDELEAALDSGAGVVGINNRDLRTFKVDLAVTEALAPEVPRGVLLVGESGVGGRDDVARMAAAGADAVLVGGGLMQEADVGAAAAALVGVAKEPGARRA